MNPKLIFMLCLLFQASSTQASSSSLEGLVQLFAKSSNVQAFQQSALARVIALRVFKRGVDQRVSGESWATGIDLYDSKVEEKLAHVRNIVHIYRVPEGSSFTLVYRLTSEVTEGQKAEDRDILETALDMFKMSSSIVVQPTSMKVSVSAPRDKLEQLVEQLAIHLRHGEVLIGERHAMNPNDKCEPLSETFTP